MRSDFATARHHLEQAQDCLHGNDHVTDQMLIALSMLIEAALMAEYTHKRTGKVVMFPLVGAGRLNPRWTVKKTFGNRNESPPS